MLGELIKEARWHARMNKSELARAVGVAYNTIHRLESGEYHDTWFSTIVAIARATGQPLEFFVQEAPRVDAADMQKVAAIAQEAERIGREDEARRQRLGLGGEK